MKKILMYLWLALPVAAQQPTKAPELKSRPGVLPLTVTEQAAFSAVSEKERAAQDKIKAAQDEFQRLQELARALEQQVKADHPGYHFEEETGRIVKDAAPAATAKADEKAVR